MKKYGDTNELKLLNIKKNYGIKINEYKFEVIK